MNFEQQLLVELCYLNQRSTKLEQKDEQKHATTIRTTCTLSPLDKIVVPMIENELIQVKIRLKDATVHDDQMNVDATREKMDGMCKMDKYN